MSKQSLLLPYTIAIKNIVDIKYEKNLNESWEVERKMIHIFPCALLIFVVMWFNQINALKL